MSTEEHVRATWDTAYIDNLDDSAFLYVEPGGKKDGEGKTVPRSLRHFPVKDANGKPDAAHVRNALARIPDSNLPASVKESATREAQEMLKNLDGSMDGRSEDPPRDNLVRVSQPFELTRTTPEGMPVLHGLGAPYNEWAEIGPSRYEGHFMERFLPGAFTKAINDNRDSIRCLFHHGMDPSIGVKPLGVISSLEETDRGVEYDVDLFPADYVRNLVPGLEAGVYGSSFKFSAIRKDDVRGSKARNPKGLLERSIREASMRELGPTPFPAYKGTPTGLRSLTDDLVLSQFPAEHLAAEVALRTQEQDLVGEMLYLAKRFTASEGTDSDAMRTIVSLLDELTGTTEAPAPSEDAAPTGTSRSAATLPSTGLFGLARDQEVAPAWRL
jgi:HK97 family phage prohead protease